MRAHPRSSFTLRRAAAAAALVAAVGTPQAANVSWVGPDDSFWDLVVNWSPGLPGALDDVLLGGFDTVFRSGTVTIRSFTGSGRLTVTGGTLMFGAASSIGELTMSAGQLGGAGSLTVTGAATLSFASMAGSGTTSFQGATAVSASGVRLDGGRIFRNEGTLTQTNASVDMNSRLSGAAEAGNGTVFNAAGAIWNSNATATNQNFIFASNQGAGDNGAGAVFTNAGTFNKLGAAVTDVRTGLVNDGSLHVQAGQLQFSTGGVLTHNGTLAIDSGAVLALVSNNAVTHTINTAASSFAGTLAITGDNFLNFTAAHTLGGTGTFQHSFGQVTGANLTLGPTLNVLITDGGHSGAATTTLQGSSTISGTSVRLDGGRIFRNEGTLTQTNASVDMNSRRAGAAEAGNGTVLNAAGAIWNSNATATNQNFIFASNQGAGDNGAGAVFTNAGTFNKLGAAVTDVRTGLVNDGSLHVQAGQLQFSTGGVLTHNGTLAIDSGAVLALVSNNAVTHTINTAASSFAGTLAITGDNFLNFTAAHTLGGTGTFQHSFGQVTGANLTLGPTLSVLITDGGHSGAATTTLQGSSTISGTSLRLDGGRIFRNEGTLTQTNASVDMNSRRAGAAEAGNGTVFNAAGAIWNSNATATNQNFIFASNQGAGDNGAGAVFTNAGTFNKLGAAVTDVRTGLVNDGSLHVQAGQLQFSTGGVLTHNGTLAIDSGAVLALVSNNAVTHTINTAASSFAGTLAITGDNFLNFTAAHTLGGTGTFQHSFGQVTGANLTLGPTLNVLITDGGHSGAATTTLQGSSTISGTSVRLDGGRIFRNEGTLTQTNASVDMNSRRAGAAEAGNGTVLNAAGAIWNSNATATNQNFIFASNQGGTDNGAGAVFTNAGTFNKLGAAVTEVRTSFANDGATHVAAGTLLVTSAFTNTGLVNVAAGANFQGSNATFVNAGTLSGNGMIATHANGDIENRGAIDPGDSTGHLTIGGTLTQAATGLLNLELASLTDFDTLHVTGDVSFDGNIVVWKAGYVPVVGDSFMVLTFGGLRLGGSTFDAVLTSGYGTGVTIQATYNPNDVTLNVVAVPEPETWALLLAGLGLTGFAARQRSGRRTA